jgi:hypothetical protein
MKALQILAHPTGTIHTMCAGGKWPKVGSDSTLAGRGRRPAWNRDGVVTSGVREVIANELEIVVPPEIRTRMMFAFE